MGLMDFISKQFVDVIDWVEDKPGVLAHRFPMTDREIQNGAELTVRETQAAAFINEGKVADVFSPGMYTLNTQTLPVLTYLRNWDKFFASPFKSDVYFFSLRDQLDQKWGTPQPITIRDKEYGPLRIRAFGTYSYKLSELEPFYTRLVGTAHEYTVADLDGQLRSLVSTTMASFLGNAEMPFVDMAANQMVFSQTLHAAIAEAFKPYGLELTSFFVQSLSLPEELQAHLDKATSMKLVGNLQNYTQFQAAESLTNAGNGEGNSLASAGAGMGAGLAMGQMMAQSMQQGLQAGQNSPKNNDDVLATIERLHGLVEKGALSKEEFDKKKAELLGKIG